MDRAPAVADGGDNNQVASLAIELKWAIATPIQRAVGRYGQPAVEMSDKHPPVRKRREITGSRLRGRGRPFNVPWLFGISRINTRKHVAEKHIAAFMPCGQSPHVVESLPVEATFDRLAPARIQRKLVVTPNTRDVRLPEQIDGICKVLAHLENIAERHQAVDTFAPAPPNRRLERIDILMNISQESNPHRAVSFAGA